MNNFKDNSDKAIRALRDAAYKGMTKAVELVEDQAEFNSPYDTGALRQSIDNIVEGARTNTIIGYVGTNSEYAIPVEKGTGEFATNGAKPAKVKNTGYVPPYIPGPLGPATLEHKS